MSKLLEKDRLRRLKRRAARGLRAVASIPSRIRVAAAGCLGRRSNLGETAQKVGFFRTRSRTFDEVVQLAWPIAVALLGDSAMGLVDTKLVAALGAPALGGVGVATMLMYLGYAVVFGLMRGVKVRTSHAVGEGRAGDGVRFAEGGVVLGLGIGVVIFALARDVGPVLTLLGVDPVTVPYGRDFLAARTFGAPAICVLSALVQWRQGVGDSRTPMIVGLLGNVVNAFLAWALIHGRFGLPALGVRGAGFGTACAEWLEVSIMIAILVRDRRRARGAPRIELRRAIGEVSAIGVPTGAQFGLETVAFTAFTAILGGIGAAEIAAHQVAMAIIRTSFLPGVAVAEAASVLVGKSLGAKNLEEADRVTRASVGIAAGFMTACGAVFAIAGGAIAESFTDDPSVSGIVRRLLLVAAVFQTVDAITIVLRGALRGAKDVRAVAIIGVTCCWACVPVAAWTLGRLAGWGAIGGWFGFLAESSIATVLFWARWRRGGWRIAYGGNTSALDAKVLAPATS